MTDTPLHGSWRDRYADLVVTAKMAVEKIRPGNRVFVGGGCGQPRALLDALVDRAKDLADVEIVQLPAAGHAPHLDPKPDKAFRINAFSACVGNRRSAGGDRVDTTPIALFDLPGLFRSGGHPIDAALIQVSPPDEMGWCSLGVSVDVVKSAAENAALVIAQVNAHMPATRGPCRVNVYDLDLLVPGDIPLPELRAVAPSPAETAAGHFAASLVEDGSTLQIGLSPIHRAMAEHLASRKDLGIHTDALGDAVIGLLASGAVTGTRKGTDRGKVVASYAAGTRRLYDLVDGDDRFAFHPADDVCDPAVIGRHPRMVAVCQAAQVDLSGQVCPDGEAGGGISCIGAQADFNRSASRSPGGKAIVVLPSTDPGGGSRIVTHLTPGVGVVIPRSDAQYVVTEHGIAFLKGKTIQERSIALISIAHPDHRERLLREAIEAGFVHSVLAEVGGKIHIGPPDLSTTFLVDDGTLVHFRPLHPTDLPRLTTLFYSLSRQSVYNRWMTQLRRLPRREIENYVFVDHRQRVAIVGTLPEASGEEIIAVGAYILDEKTNRAEVAFTVHDDWQNRGIGTFLHATLVQIARRNGIAGFTAEVLRENRAMRTVFNNTAKAQVSTQLEDGIYLYEMEFE